MPRPTPPYLRQAVVDYLKKVGEVLPDGRFRYIGTMDDRTVALKFGLPAGTIGNIRGKDFGTIRLTQAAAIASKEQINKAIAARLRKEEEEKQQILKLAEPEDEETVLMRKLAEVKARKAAALVAMPAETMASLLEDWENDPGYTDMDGKPLEDTEVMQIEHDQIKQTISLMAASIEKLQAEMAADSKVSEENCAKIQAYLDRTSNDITTTRFVLSRVLFKVNELCEKLGEPEVDLISDLPTFRSKSYGARTEKVAAAMEAALEKWWEKR